MARDDVLVLHLAWPSPLRAGSWHPLDAQPGGRSGVGRRFGGAQGYVRAP